MIGLISLTHTNSGYCCLNSTLHTRINASAWYAVIYTKILNDLFVHSPIGELLAPWGRRLLLFVQLIETGALP